MGSYYTYPFRNLLFLLHWFQLLSQKRKPRAPPPQFQRSVGASLGPRLLPRGWRLGARRQPSSRPSARAPAPPARRARALRDRRDGWCLCQPSGGTSHARWGESLRGAGEERDGVGGPAGWGAGARLDEDGLQISPLRRRSEGKGREIINSLRVLSPQNI